MHCMGVCVCGPCRGRHGAVAPCGQADPVANGFCREANSGSAVHRPPGLVALRAHGSSPSERVVVALALLSWGGFSSGLGGNDSHTGRLWRGKFPGFYSNRVGEFQHLRLPGDPRCASMGVHLQAYTIAMAIPEGQPIFRGGAAYLEKIIATLFVDTLYCQCRWHGLRRGGGAATAYHWSLAVAYFVVGTVAQACHGF